MKLVGLIYNPVAGDTAFRHRVDQVIATLQSGGVLVIPYRTTAPGDAAVGAKELIAQGCSALLVAGGDGTIHQVVNTLVQEQADIPLGVFPAGTANDFAVQLGLPKNPDAICNLVLENRVRRVDLGMVNNRVFVNVASAGALTDVSYNIDLGLKNTLGKLGYYLKGLEQLPRMRPVDVEIKLDNRIISGPISLLLVLNGGYAGGFQLVPKADLQDGLLDVLIVRTCQWTEFIGLFLKLFRGEHINDPKVSFYQTSSLSVNSLTSIETDVDGEQGPHFPWQVAVLPGRLQIFAPGE